MCWSESDLKDLLFFLLIVYSLSVMKAETEGMSYNLPNRWFSSAVELTENYDVHGHVGLGYKIFSFLFEWASCCSKQCQSSEEYLFLWFMYLLWELCSRRVEGNTCWDLFSFSNSIVSPWKFNCFCDFNIASQTIGYSTVSFLKISDIL